jgi:aldose 1-epimerase
MAPTRRDAGRLADGTPVEEIAISAPGLSARVLTFGATLASLVLDTPSGPREVLLGFDRLEDWVAHGAYFGCIAGRCANRIAGGRFELDGRAYELPRNDGGRHHLHGGTLGFGRRVWRVADADGRSATLALTSPDGEEGYPGTVEATCRYTVDESRRLVIELTATTDAPTLVNLAGHGYFALDDGPDVLDHRLTIAAEAHTPADAELIPTGEIRPVAGTRFDFRTERPVRNGPGEAHAGYDDNFVLATAPSAEPRFAARLRSARSGVALDLHTTEPGLQVYDGGFLPVAPPLRGGRPGVRHGGICLEPQRFPDAVHYAGFPGSVLRPGEVYRQRTEYRFTV